MPANTPNYGLTYPVLADTPNGAGEMQTLATQIDSALLLKSVKPPTPVTPSWQNGTSDITLPLSGNHAPILGVAISDPGYAYTLEISACVAITNGTAWSVLPLPSTDLNVNLTSVTGTLIAHVQGNGYYTAAFSGYNVVLPTFTTAPLTGPQSVYLSGFNLNTNGGNMIAAYGGLATKSTWMYVKVVPV
jgi:hypothetical protein